MTTAHKPTFNAAIGGPDQGGNRIIGGTRAYSSRDLPGHLKLKNRQTSSAEEAKKKDLKAELEDKERKHSEKRSREKDDRKRGDRGEDRDKERDRERKLLDAPKDKGPPVETNIDADDDDEEPPQRAFSKIADKDDDDDDEDDTAELLRELERIKRERAEEQLRKEKQRLEKEAKEKEEQMLKGNPLINMTGPASFSVKRRWDDDVVFKNQTRGEPVKKKRFINDTVRNDFHRRFLEKYIQ
mmetsp:Transcript_1557/g.2951  ORF Transcript_1557/g.2951 Transcript_1557/m.2951 type:complete len:241 (-) Transcript_1557:752-1474(-)